jgi:hypothetical protein
MRTQFDQPGIEIGIGRSRLSDVLSRRVALKTHNLPNDVLKTTLVVEDVVSRCGKPWELIFYNLRIVKATDEFVTF